MSRNTTFGQMLQWCEKPSGKRLNDNRAEIVDVANKVRQLFYLLYEDGATSFTTSECMEVQDFPLDCHDCAEVYQGLTLPDSIDTVEAIWRNSARVIMRTRWREYRIGLQVDNTCKIELFNVHTTVPTGVEIPAGECSKLGVLGHDRRDFGKEVRLTFRDSGGQKFSEIVKVDGQYTFTNREAKSIVQSGVILPQLHGGVTLAMESGDILSEYRPHERVPTYRRVKLTGVAAGDQLSVKGLTRFTPAFFDHDVVETDNQLAIEEAARYLRFQDSDSPELAAKADRHLERCKGYLFGEKSRELGKTTIKRIEFGPRKAVRSGLGANRRIR